MQQLYGDHFTTVQSIFNAALEAAQLDYLLIPSGAPIRMHMDDMDYPFKVNAYFNYWLPLTSVPHCWLIVQADQVPTLIYYQPNDYWHKVETLPEDAWTDCFKVTITTQAEPNFPLPKGRGALLGNGQQYPALRELILNPKPLLDYVNWHRTYKTDYEIASIRAANRLALPAHQAAEQAFREGLSEAEINQQYLSVLRCTSDMTPYRNIVCLNSNASILHYTVYQPERLPQNRSFLIDAGASVNGYASDITRTYAHQAPLFQELINALDDLQQKLIKAIKPGLNYADLHDQAHRLLTQLLIDFDFIQTSFDNAWESQLSGTFFPHGLGHFLGLWVHDPSGHQQSVAGGTKAPDAKYPFLRNTRDIEPRQVFTIEPGLYFIDSLLANLKTQSAGKFINWSKIDSFKEYGGIRIEDNIAVFESNVENLTRNP